MIKDYKFINIWKKRGDKTSSLKDEAIRVKQGKSFLYLVPYASDMEYNECTSHSIKIMTEDEFNKEYSLVELFP